MLTPVNLDNGQPTLRKLPIFAAFTQGFFCLVLGLWPVVSFASFQAVTGEKADHWLISVVGMLLAAIGSTMLIAAIRRDIAFEVFSLGIVTALSLACTDVIFVIERSIPAVYLLDAVAESLFVTLWVFAIRDLRRPRRLAASQPPPPGIGNLTETGRPDGPK
jgi:peptidoglycan/LPS O-acetylase OafA/YrhL